MPIIKALIAKHLIQQIFTSVIAPHLEEAKGVALDSAHDTIKGMIAGKMSVEELADISIVGIDKIKDRIVSEGNVRYIGGKLKFSFTDNKKDKVRAYFELYFLDEFEKWQKAEADTDIPSSRIKPDALEDIQAKGEIVFEIE